MKVHGMISYVCSVTKFKGYLRSLLIGPRGQGQTGCSYTVVESYDRWLCGQIESDLFLGHGDLSSGIYRVFVIL